MKSKRKDLVGKEIRKKISEIGKLWRKSENNPKKNAKCIEQWLEIINQWKNDKKMPLIIRKQTGIRGSEIKHKNTGRSIIITDNSFAQWIYFNILNNKVFSLEEIREMLSKDEIPFSFAIKNKDKKNVKYKKCLGKYSVNKMGWKLCHIEPIGLNRPEKISELDIKLLEKHFFKMANPKNMFLVPLDIGGIGEIQEFIKEQI